MDGNNYNRLAIPFTLGIHFLHQVVGLCMHGHIFSVFYSLGQVE